MTQLDWIIMMTLFLATPIIILGGLFLVKHLKDEDELLEDHAFRTRPSPPVCPPPCPPNPMEAEKTMRVEVAPNIPWEPSKPPRPRNSKGRFMPRSRPDDA